MPRVEMWFPVAIYTEDYLFSEEQNNVWAQHILNYKNTVPPGGDGWYGNTYTTHGTFDILNDPVFDPLVKSITQHVNNFAKMHGSNGVFQCDYAWANIADAGQFQEGHTHNGNTFSLSYYITAPEGAGQIVFEDPKEPDMKPIKKIVDRNTLSFIKTGITPKQGSVVIFRSYLRHLVTPGINTEPRISISMNFN